MIEDVFDEERGIVSARRVYDCKVDGKIRLLHVAQDADGHLYHETFTPTRHAEMHCGGCGHGPLLWDGVMRRSYVLAPFVIIEEPW